MRAGLVFLESVKELTKDISYMTIRRRSTHRGDDKRNQRDGDRIESV